MKKSDLKDGMIITNRKGARFIAMVVSGMTIDMNTDEVIRGNFDSFNDDLIHECSNEWDMMKIEYMGETVWERKEYVTFLEALSSEKRIKLQGGYRFLNVSEAFHFMNTVYNHYGGTKEVTRLMREKLWEIEQ